MFLALPFRFLKYLMRIPRGKYRPASAREFFAQSLKTRVDRGELNRRRHCNVSTIFRLRKLLAAFDAKVYCVDPSLNLLSLLLRPWFGRQIMAIVKQKKT